MSTINDGGPAFPHEYQHGMTLRDHFAGLAMQALLSNPNICDMADNAAQQWTAQKAYLFADAMIKVSQPCAAYGAQGSAEGEGKL